jgi:UDP-glucose 4-epimerase
MNVLVTGGAGYIGSICVEQLCQAGHDVTVIDDISQGHPPAVDKRARFVQARVGDGTRVPQILLESKAEAIVHFAASALVPESMTNPGKYFRNNVGDTINLLNSTVAAGIKKFVFSSTCATYGPPDRVPMTEDLPQRPISPYGESKLIVERMLRWYQEIHGLEFVAFRYFNAAGASEKLGEDHNPETHLIPNVLRVALGQLPHVEIYGTDYPTPDGTCIRDYIHVIDLSIAHILALQPGKSGYYNLGIGDGYSVREVVSACQKVTGRKIPVVEKARRAGDAPKLVASAEKARKELGWTPKLSGIETIVQTAWQWHSKHPNGYAK